MKNHVRINENRTIIGYAKGVVTGEGLIEVDFDPEQTVGHKLKENYQDFSGDAQWEVDTEKQHLTSKIHAIEEIWMQIPEPLRMHYGQHYDSVRTKLEDNNPQEALEYLVILSDEVSDKNKPLLTGLAEAIRDIFKLED